MRLFIAGFALLSISGSAQVVEVEIESEYDLPVLAPPLPTDMAIERINRRLKHFYEAREREWRRDPYHWDQRIECNARHKCSFIWYRTPVDVEGRTTGPAERVGITKEKSLGQK
jgi:hypothetical protein